MRRRVEDVCVRSACEEERESDVCEVASFPGSPLAKNRKGGGVRVEGRAWE